MTTTKQIVTEIDERICALLAQAVNEDGMDEFQEGQMQALTDLKEWIES